MNIKMTLRPAALTWLGSGITEKSIISPLATIQVQGFSNEDREELIKQNIIESDNVIKAECYVVLENLALADAYSGIKMSGSFGQIAKTAFFNGEKRTFIDSGIQDLTVANYLDLDGLSALLNEVSGTSRLVNAKLELRFDAKTALAFVALVDVTRRKAMAYYAGLEEMPLGYQAEEILAMAESGAGTRWLSAYLKTLPLPGLSLNGEELAAAMQVLDEGALVEQGEYGYRLLGEAHDLAANFLIIENLLNVRCGQIQAGQIITSEALFLQAGLHDLLMIDYDGQGIDISTVSSYTMQEYVQNILLTRPKKQEIL